MSFDPILAESINFSLEGFPQPLREDLAEKKMFGGLAFLLRRKMTVGVMGKEIIVRVVDEKVEGVLRETGVRPMDFNGKSMREFVFVSPEAFENEETLKRWIYLGIEHARRQLNL